MGEKEVNLPKTSKGWAIHLSKLLNYFHEEHGGERFPIKIADIALEYSKSVFPNEPITLVEGSDAFHDFEGALIPSPSANGEWGIFYNSGMSSNGRINFTLAHELGHYLLHRHLIGEPQLCAQSDMWAWNSEYGQMETEANEFASYLLMPLDDFRKQTKNFKKPNIIDFKKIANRYGVSLTAAILKWLTITDQRAMIVISRDGFMDWARSSDPLFKSGVFFKAKQKIIPVPSSSIASRNKEFIAPEHGEQFPARIWSKTEQVFESAIFSEYHDMVISLLIYPKSPPNVFLPPQRWF